MSLAVCDPAAFYPLRDLVHGPLHTLEDLAAVERFLRTVLLHDEIFMELEPFGYDSDREEVKDEDGDHFIFTAIGPALTGFDFFLRPSDAPMIPRIDLSPALIKVAVEHSNTNEGDGGEAYLNAHLDFLRITMGVVTQGGSALLCGRFGQKAISSARRYPELFQHLDEEWQQYGRAIENEGFGLIVPPVLGIVLSRAARRDAIPAVITDLRDEWRGARAKVWDLLRAQLEARTVEQAEELRRELSEASKLFTPTRTDMDSRPTRVLWEILAVAGAGGGIALLAGGDPVVGAVAGALTQAARTIPHLLQEIGPALFGRGAFDLANRVRRELQQVETDALSRLLTDAEKRALRIA